MKIWRLKLNYITKFICDFIRLLKLICCCKGRSSILGNGKVPRRIFGLAWSK
jgi:hypothetical protein